jgi:hypothetical protein
MANEKGCGKVIIEMGSYTPKVFIVKVNERVNGSFIFVMDN